jgi:hypothetical protein
VHDPPLQRSVNHPLVDLPAAAARLHGAERASQEAKEQTVKTGTTRKLTLLALMLFGVFVGSAEAHSTGNPGILPPTSRPYGNSYGEWSARHWQWDYSLPVDHHPLFDTADCSTGQSGPVWFLGGTFIVTPTSTGGVIGTATRDCTVPAGKALFFPIIDAECATAEGDGTTEQQLRDCAVGLVDHAVNLSAEVDGVAVQNLAAFRVQSPLFTWGPLPENNVFQDPNLPAGRTSPSVSDGYFLMLAPLSVGTHTIHFKGSAVFTQAQDGFDFTFSLDITYHLTVTA